MSWASEFAGNRGSRCARIVRDRPGQTPTSQRPLAQTLVAAAPIALVWVCAKADQLLMAGRILRGVPVTQVIRHDPRVPVSCRPVAAAIYGVDLGKTRFDVMTSDSVGKPVQLVKLGRDTILRFFEAASPALIGMEACPGAQWLARKLAAMGHTVRIIPAQLVKPFLKSNENDARGAEAIAEAVVRPTTRFVGIKTESQVDLQALHRVRDRIVSNRTQLICQMRAFCLEYGIAMRQGAGVFKIDTMMNALLGPDSPPIGDPDGKKGTGWRSSRKAGEGQTKKVGPTLQDPTG